MELELTTEQIEKSILAAYDSLNLLNELKLKEDLSEKEIELKIRNISHIKIMLEKSWFFEALSLEQKIELELSQI